MIFKLGGELINSLVFFDLDGTLMNSQFQLNMEVARAINIMKNNGNVPIIATGRPFNQIKGLIRDTKINSYILTNGQYIYCEGTIIGNYVISPIVIEELQMFLKRYNMAAAFYNNEDYVITEENHLTRKTFKTFNIPKTRVDAQFYKKNEILMMLVFSDNFKSDQILKEKFPTLNFFRTSPYSLDVINKSSSKAVAIHKIKEYLGLPNIPTYAFGDSMNDLEMIKTVDNGVAMGNAIPEVKRAADLIVSTNDSGGIIEGLKHYNLI